MRRRRLNRLVLCGVLLAACAGERTREAPASGAAPASPEERIARWTREHPGEPLTASISFHQLLHDSTVVALLARHDVQPYVAQVWAGGVTMYAQVPPEQAGPQVIAQARTQLLQRLQRATCNVSERIERMSQDRAAVARRDSIRAAPRGAPRDSLRATPADDTERARTMLGRLRAEAEGFAQVRAGGAVIWAVYVVGSPDNVRRLGADALVASFEPIEITTEEGELLVGVPRPAEPAPVGQPPRYPDIDALGEADVEAELQAYARRPTTNCAHIGASVQTIPGHWQVVARRAERAVLMRDPARRQSARTTSPDDARRGVADTAYLQAMVFARDEPLASVSVEPIELVLPGVPPERARALRIGRIRTRDIDAFIALPGRSPTLLPAPPDHARYLFEEANALWLFTDPGAVQRLTAERVDSFDVAALTAKQREGEVILYWAAAPSWSPDGQRIAYVTNREAVQGDTRGQSIWLLDVPQRAERPLLNDATRSFHPTGWIDRELTFSGPPGVFAIDVNTGARRELSRGTVIGAAENGSAIAVAENVPDAPRIAIVTRTGTQPVEPPPAGLTYAAQANFSPGATRLLLLATAQLGTVRRYFVFDRRTGRHSPVPAPTDQQAEWPQWLDDDHLLVPVIDAATGQLNAHIVDLRQ